MPKPDFEPKVSQISVSQPLEDALLTSDRDLGGKPVDVSHLLLAILTQDGLGKRSMEIVSKGLVSYSNLIDSLRKRQEPSENLGKISINGQKVVVTSQVASLLADANNQAKGNLYVDTGHVIQAELNRLDSVLKNVFGPVDASSAKPIGNVLSSFIGIARKERKYSEPAANYSVQSESANLGNQQIVDLIANVKEIDQSQIFINPEWTLALIQAVTSNRLTVIMTEHDEEVSMAIQGLAVELANHGSQYRDIPKIIVPDSSALIDDPEGVLTQAVSDAQDGGVLVLPDDPKYLTLKIVRLALERRNIRVLSYAEEKSWAKSKGILGQLNAHELYLSPPKEETILEVLRAQKESLEVSYNKNGEETKITVTISDEALRVSAKLGYRYASVMNMSSILASKKLLETAATNLKLTLSGMEKLLPFKVKKDTTIDSDDIYLALKSLTGIELQPENPERLLQMESELGKKIIGQEEAISIISKAIRRSETPLKDPRRPRAVFMFLGPSGVGKTELARALNDFIFHDNLSFIQLNMSEYMQQENVARLIGAPPGYIGYEEGGQLTEQIRKHPYSVLVADEIEKAHSSVPNMFLQVFEEGNLTDGKGRVVDFKNTIIILTGNIGAEYFDDVDKRGFETVKKDVIHEMQKTFKPEFINRLDSVIVFKPLSPQAISKIVDLRIQDINDQLRDNNIKIELTSEMHKFLEQVGYDPKYGARPLKRAVSTYIGDDVSTKLLSKEFKSGDTIMVDYTDGKVKFSKKK